MTRHQSRTPTSPSASARITSGPRRTRERRLAQRLAGSARRRSRTSTPRRPLRGRPTYGHTGRCVPGVGDRRRMRERRGSLAAVRREDAAATGCVAAAPSAARRRSSSARPASAAGAAATSTRRGGRGQRAAIAVRAARQTTTQITRPNHAIESTEPSARRTPPAAANSAVTSRGLSTRLNSRSIDS